MPVHWSVNLNNFLFENFNCKTVPSFLAVCLSSTLLAVFFEYLQLVRIQSLARIRCLQQYPDEPQRINFSRLWNYVIDVMTNILNTLLGFLFMLVVMTFNGYLIISIAIGASIGFFLYGRDVMLWKYNNFLKVASGTMNQCSHECSSTNANLLQNEEINITPEL